MAIGNDNSRSIFLFQHGWKEEERKEMWSRIETPKLSLEQGAAVSWLHSGPPFNLMSDRSRSWTYAGSIQEKQWQSDVQMVQCGSLSTHRSGKCTSKRRTVGNVIRLVCILVESKCRIRSGNRMLICCLATLPREETTLFLQYGICKSGCVFAHAAHTS